MCSDPGNSGTTYNSGNQTTDANGAFCFNSGTYPSGGPYQAKFGGEKGDTYSFSAVGSFSYEDYPDNLFELL